MDGTLQMQCFLLWVSLTPLCLLCTGAALLCAVGALRQSGRLTRARRNKMKARGAVTNPSRDQLCEAVLYFEKAVCAAN